MDGSLKKEIIAVVEPVFLYPLVGQIIGFGQVSALTMLHHLFLSYRTIDKIYLEENSANIMGTYDPIEPLTSAVPQPFLLLIASNLAQDGCLG